MLAMILANDGNFEPQRLFVNKRMLVLADDGGPSIMQRLLGADGRSGFDLTLLESIASGDEIKRMPTAALLPAYAVQGKESFDRLLLLSFFASEAICLWFSSSEDCELCRHAI